MNVDEIQHCTIFLCRAGSHAYGTNTPESDIDIRGVCIPTNLSYYVGFGLKHFEQKTDGWPENEDKTVYDLRKAIKLMADNNPNMLELLYTRPEDTLHSTIFWHNIVDHRKKFLSKKVRYRYSGYAYAQLKRIETHRNYLLNPPKKQPLRKDFGLQEKRMLTKHQEESFLWLISRLLEDSIEEMKLTDEVRKVLREVNYIGLLQSKIPDDVEQIIKRMTNAPDEWVQLLLKEKAYANAKQNWISYENWGKTRNPKRHELEKKYGFDAKHALHLVRLLRQGIEILKTETLEVYRQDREELLAIRNGAWTFEELKDYFNRCEKELHDLYATTSLPNTPDLKFIDKLCIETIQDYLGFKNTWL